MKIDEIIKLLKKYGLLIIAVVIFEAPLIWITTNFLFKERIETLNATIRFLETRVSQYSRNIANTLKSSDDSGSPVGKSGENEKIIENQDTVLYPKINNPQKLRREEVRQLAEFYNLFSIWRINPHLRFKDGDISYWFEQGLSEEQLKLEFESRRIVLERAEQTGKVIDTQGDLSFYAQQIQSQILRSRRGS